MEQETGKLVVKKGGGEIEVEWCRSTYKVPLNNIFPYYIFYCREKSVTQISHYYMSLFSICRKKEKEKRGGCRKKKHTVNQNWVFNN